MLKFLVHANISGMSWFNLQKQKYTIVKSNKLQSFCHNEIQIDIQHIEGYDINDKNTKDNL